MHFPLQDNQPVFGLQEKISLPLLEVANCILDDLAHFERLQSCQGHVASAETLFSNGKSRPRYLNKSENRKVRRRKADTRSSWLNCALRDDEAVYWVSIGHYEAVAVGN